MRSAVKHDTSPALRTLKPAPKASGSTKISQIPLHVVPHAQKQGVKSGSAAVQKGEMTNTMPSFEQNFDGVGNRNNVLPPDTQGDVGPNNYVQMINLSFAIWDKQGNLLYGPVNNTTLWQGFGGPCETFNGGDPITMYDEVADRWFMSQLAYPGGSQGYHQCIAISQTPDPTGAWYRYDFLFSQTTLNDYPKFGVWPDAYYASANEFGPGFTGVSVQAYERDKMLAGQSARVVTIHIGDSSGIYASLLPGDAEGGALGFNPPSGAPNPFVMFDDDAWGFSATDRILMWDFHVDWTNPASSTFGVGSDHAPNRYFETAAFDSNLCNYARSCIPQPGTSVKLDSLADRLMHRAAYRNFGDHQGIALTHSVDVNGQDHAGVRWYELNQDSGGWSLADQGTYAPDSDNRWMGSAAMDASGDLAVGYSVSSTSTFPSIRVAGRLVSDPAGQLSQGEAEMKAGGGSQTHSASRWGDYSAMQVDPTNGCTYWYTTEYMPTTSVAGWQTRIGSFKFPSCTAGPHGDLTGTVTDSSNNTPIAGAHVGTSLGTTTTDDQGHYKLTLPTGTYDVTFSAFGYISKTVNGVEITDGGTTTLDAALDPAPRVHVTGTVTDASGHGWPMYARVSATGTPVSTFTDPVTGTYSLTLPANATYTIVVKSESPGYGDTTETVDVGGSDMTLDLTLIVNRCAEAPGYEFGTKIAVLGDYGGQIAGFLSSRGIPSSVFHWGDDPSQYDAIIVNLPGNPGKDAFLSFLNAADAAGTGVVFLDTWYGTFVQSGIWLLWQHVGNPSSRGTGYSTTIPYTFYKVTAAHPILDGFAVGDEIAFDTTSFYKMHAWFGGYDGESRQVIADAGRSDTGVLGSGIAVQERANNRHALLSMHAPSPYINPGNWTDDGRQIFLDAVKWVAPSAVFECVTIPGGLVVGNVNDANTGAGINGATVTSDDKPADKAKTRATPDDPNVGDGFYSLFSSLTGSHSFTASKAPYQPESQTVNVVADDATRADFSLKVGRLLIDPQSVTKSQVLGTTTTATVKFSNTGSAPADVKLSERRGSFQILTMEGSPLRRAQLESPADPGWLGDHQDERVPGVNAGPPNDPTWSTIAAYPSRIMDNSADIIDGKVYSVGGYNGSAIIANGYVYDPAENAWSAIANMPLAREKPGVAAVDGKLYVTGGWNPSGAPIAQTDVYDPATDSWTTVSPNPKPAAAPGVAVADGKIYLVGGCTTSGCATTTNVVSYDPTTDTWSSNASYPHNNAWESCGGIGSTVYCSGGTNGSATYKDGFAYDPGSDSWSPIADMPLDLWASAYGAPNGLLVLSSGVTNGFSTVTNQGVAYNPSTDSWSTLPNAQFTRYRAGGSCGFYKLGGSSGGFSPTPESELLSELDQCGVTDVPWLDEAPTTFTLAPGESVDVTVTLMATSDAGVTQPGTYTAQIGVSSNTPYKVNPVDVTMNVTPPKGWGKIAGTVTGTDCSGNTSPLQGVQVQANGRNYTFSLKTDKAGKYALWAPAGSSPYTVIASKDGWIAQTKMATIKANKTTTVNFNLQKAGC